jgi:CheY-like chemotaxis protein
METTLAPFRILLVEDNPNDVEITRRALERGLQADGSLPGLILLDLNLPKVDGREVLSRIKSHPRLKRIPVIVLTTSTREEDIVRTYDLGVNTFISKPVRFEDFIKVVSAIQEYWIVIATLPPTAPSAGVS